jgi:hypothetical protein
MSFKRKRPKNRRAGCLLCKAHKMNKAKKNFEWKTRSQSRADLTMKEEMRGT